MIYLLPHTILHSAEKFPNKEAFKCGNHSLSFAQMKNRMNQLANVLHELGIKKGDRVGIYLNRSIETAIAMYGIMQAGAVYVPLDPKAPIHRTQFLLDDCNIEILLSHHSQRRNLRKIVADKHPLKTIIGVKGEWDIPTITWEETTRRSTIFENPFPMMEKDLAYIMYTSGSTGNPKGIMHSHASGLAYARLSASLYNINEQDKIGNHAPIYFDISTLGYFTAPFVGATTVIITDAHTVLPTSLSQLIETEALTIWYSVPLAVIQMLQNGGLEERDWSSLRWVLYGGEPFPPKYLQTLMTALPNTRFCNVYGPAEVNQCTYYHIPTAPTDNTSIPLGKVWGNTESLVLDENGEEIHKNGVGELLIRSTTMMTGYWQNPTLTAKGLYKRLAPNGLEEVFYKTGDLVELDENGLLHFMGRKDHQIKVRGYRVELDAVENVLVAHAKVLESAVFAIKENDVNTINAAVILQKNEQANIEELISFLKEKLPSYAVPTSIRILETFPRTGSGKVSRSALKAHWK